MGETLAAVAVIGPLTVHAEVVAFMVYSVHLI